MKPKTKITNPCAECGVYFGKHRDDCGRNLPEIQIRVITAKGQPRKPYHVLLIPSVGDPIRLEQEFVYADAAAWVGRGQAIESFGAMETEVVVIHTESRQAVRNVFVDGIR